MQLAHPKVAAGVDEYLTSGLILFGACEGRCG
jgi:hypothetical protein